MNGIDPDPGQVPNQEEIRDFLVRIGAALSEAQIIYRMLLNDPVFQQTVGGGYARPDLARSATKRLASVVEQMPDAVSDLGRALGA